MRVVPRCDPSVCVPQQFAYREQIGASLCEQGCVRMTKIVKSNRRSDLGSLAGEEQWPNVMVLPPRMAVRLREHWPVPDLSTN
jgi:hypothetical protein